MYNKKILFFAHFFLIISLIHCDYSSAKKKFSIDYDKVLLPSPDSSIQDKTYFKPYLDFLEEVFDTMDREYYLDVSHETYEDFVESYKEKLLLRLRDRENVVPKIKYLGAGLLVNKLKDPKDIFSGFIPPKEAKEYKSEVLGYSEGIGVKGSVNDMGYLIERVELRSDAYKKGLRPGDIILRINDKKVTELTDAEFKDMLYPPIGSILKLQVLVRSTGKSERFKVEVIQFFKETLSTIPTHIPGMFYVKIDQFNKKTGTDLTMLVNYFMAQQMDKLVLDLRGNGGGPPLAAREIAGMFFDPGVELFYFQRKNRPKVTLSTPYSPVRYRGAIAILIDKGSGSASELFAGTMKYRSRAIIIGQERSAGKTFLKSMFSFSDNSMVVLVTSPAYLFNNMTYSFEGIEPDYIAPKDAKLFPFILKCMDTENEKN